MITPILQTTNLSKYYRNTAVVEDVNLTVNSGDIYGLLGQNGAGKTTTLRMILGLIKPTAGLVELFGQPPHSSAYARIGSIIETPGFYGQLTASENLEMHRRMSGIPEKDSVKEYLNLVELGYAANKKVKHLSLGMRQRLGIARALMHRPDLLILDEPINGLDPVGIKETRELIIYLHQKREMTVIISSHILGEIQLMANRIGIMHHGNLIRQLDAAEIQNTNRKYIDLKVDDDQKSVIVLEQQLGMHQFKVWEKGNIRLYEGFELSGDINRILVQHGIAVREMAFRSDTLEDYFIQETSGKEIS
jgi:ABC-type multidrug transport system ATPase subunit